MTSDQPQSMICFLIHPTFETGLLKGPFFTSSFSVDSLKAACAPHSSQVKVRIKVMLRPTVNQSVILGVKPQLGPKIIFLLLLESCGFVYVWHPLWREGWSLIYNLLLALTSAVILSSEFRETHDQILLSQNRYFSRLESRASQGEEFIMPFSSLLFTCTSLDLQSFCIRKMKVKLSP
jgi:hypothetical protein